MDTLFNKLFALSLVFCVSVFVIKFVNGYTSYDEEFIAKKAEGLNQELQECKNAKKAGITTSDMDKYCSCVYDQYSPFLLNVYEQKRIKFATIIAFNISSDLSSLVDSEEFKEFVEEINEQKSAIKNKKLPSIIEECAASYLAKGETLPLSPKQAEPSLFMDENRYVVRGDVAIFHFSVTGNAMITMVIDVENGAPVDIFGTKGKLSVENYLGDQRVINNDQSVFDEPASKQGVYKSYKVSFAAEKGEYSIVVDNTDAFTPTRGDAAVKLKLYSQPS